MCRRAGMLLGWDDASRRCVVTTASCDSWTCEECAERKATHWQMRAALGARAILDAGERLDFSTITSHEKLTNWEATERVWKNAWQTLYARLRRKKTNLSYLLIPERHRDGRMHVHALWNAGVSRRWLKDNARAAGLGYQCDVQQVGSLQNVQRYVTKYLTKQFDADADAHFRRVRVSQNWPEVPAPDSADSGLRWEYTTSEAALFMALADAQLLRYSVVDQKSGGIYDYDASAWMSGKYAQANGLSPVPQSSR